MHDEGDIASQDSERNCWSVCDDIIAVVCVHLTKTHSHYAPIQITDTLSVPSLPHPLSTCHQRLQWNLSESTQSNQCARPPPALCVCVRESRELTLPHILSKPTLLYPLSRLRLIQI